MRPVVFRLIVGVLGAAAGPVSAGGSVVSWRAEAPLRLEARVRESVAGAAPLVWTLRATLRPAEEQTDPGLWSGWLLVEGSDLASPAEISPEVWPEALPNEPIPLTLDASGRVLDCGVPSLAPWLDAWLGVLPGAEVALHSSWDQDLEMPITLLGPETVRVSRRVKVSSTGMAERARITAARTLIEDADPTADARPTVIEQGALRYNHALGVPVRGEWSSTISPPGQSDPRRRDTVFTLAPAPPDATAPDGDAEPARE